MDILKMNSQCYEKLYAAGYGIKYPDSHVIRIFESYIKNMVDVTQKLKLLDFGCGTGTHAQFFREKNFDVYGVDVNAMAIEACKKKFDDQSNQFHCIAPGTDVGTIFDEKFDIIFSNQVLYFLDKESCSKAMNQFDELLNEGGVVVFTMMATENYFYQLSKDVGLPERMVQIESIEDMYIYFIESNEHMVSYFSIFEPHQIGSYDFTNHYGSSKHYYFVGKKCSNV